jgi:hypothetical protein
MIFRRGSRGTPHRLAIAAAFLLPAMSPASTNELSARDLVASVAKARGTSGFRMRATMARSAPGTPNDATRQVTVRGRVDGGSAHALYVCLSPKLQDGQAVLIDRKAGGGTEVFVFTPPDSLDPLPPGRSGDRLFGTDFTIADMAESFWSWPASLAPGETNLLGHSCVPVDFRNPAKDAAAPASVRAWIAPDISLPLLVETFDDKGVVIRRLHSEKLVRRAGEVWAPMFVIAEDLQAGSRTTLAIRGGERDIEVPPEDFTAAGIARLIAGGGSRVDSADGRSPAAPAEGP